MKKRKLDNPMQATANLSDNERLLLGFVYEEFGWCRAIFSNHHRTGTRFLWVGVTLEGEEYDSTFPLRGGETHGDLRDLAAKIARDVKSLRDTVRGSGPRPLRGAP